jgi:hypothetical protein
VCRNICSSSLRALLGVLAFQAIVSCDASGSQRICALLAPEDCAKNPSCNVVSARRLEPERECGSASEAIACRNLEQACGDALTLARDMEGALFLLPNTCLPEGWREDADAGDTGELEEWPACE